MSDETLFCNSCHYQISSATDRNEHYRSEWHRYNVKRRCAGLQSISQTVFTTQISALKSNTQAPAQPTVKVKTKCLTCQKSFASKSSYEAHLLSKKHISKSNDQSQESNSIEYEVKQTNGNAEAEDEDDEKMDDDEKDGESDYIPIEYEGYELQYGEAPIPVLSCLFCTCPAFADIDSAVEHMHKQHGLFLPFADCLVDKSALLKYLGEKVGIGHVCVYCNQRFASTSAVQKHMASQSHAKLRFDNEEDEAEYEDYYDFTQGDQSSKSLTGRSLTGMTDAGELLLSDGSTIGHRQYQHIYAQRVSLPATKTEGELAASANMHAINQAQQQALTKYDANGQLIVTSNKHINQDKDSGKRYRETWVRKNERRLLLKVGMRNNIQDHYRAQVQF